jgi:hypothetical protein
MTAFALSELLRSKAGALFNVLAFYDGRRIVSVMAGFIPAIHVWRKFKNKRRGCPGQARA